jgi:hypothetical protein
MSSFDEWNFYKLKVLPLNLRKKVRSMQRDLINQSIRTDNQEPDGSYMVNKRHLEISRLRDMTMRRAKSQLLSWH